MTTHDYDSFRRLFLPYCLKRLADGSWVILNRQYKPLGVPGRGHVSYEAYSVKLKGLTRARIAALSCNGLLEYESQGTIWLYSDGCLPDASKANWVAYQARLAVLMRLSVAPTGSALRDADQQHPAQH